MLVGKKTANKVNSKCKVCSGEWKKSPVWTNLKQVIKLNLCRKHKRIFNSANGGTTLI